MTDDGRKTLQYFQGRISPAIRNEIDCYFKENKMSMRNEVSVLSDYSKTPDGDYEANLQALDKGSRLVGVTLTVPNEEIAASICEKWQKNNQKIYQYLIENSVLNVLLLYLNYISCAFCDHFNPSSCRFTGSSDASALSFFICSLILTS
jgi:hypothetical protein